MRLFPQVFTATGQRAFAARNLRRFLFFALLWAAVLPATARGAALRVVAEKDSVPFSYTDENGVLTGFDVDIAGALCRQLRQDCAVTLLPFEELLPALAEGRADLAVSGFAATPEREKLVDFTGHYYRGLTVFIEKPGTVNSLAPEDMAGKRVGVQTGSIQEDYLRRTYGDAIVLVRATNYPELFEEMQRGETDIALMDALSGYALLKSSLGEGLETLGEPVSGEQLNTTSHIAVSKLRPGLRDAVDQALKELVQSGEYAKINRKYFAFGIY